MIIIINYYYYYYYYYYYRYYNNYCLITNWHNDVCLQAQYERITSYYRSRIASCNNKLLQEAIGALRGTAATQGANHVYISFNKRRCLANEGLVNLAATTCCRVCVPYGMQTWFANTNAPDVSHYSIRLPYVDTSSLMLKGACCFCIECVYGIAFVEAVVVSTVAFAGASAFISIEIDSWLLFTYSDAVDNWDDERHQPRQQINLCEWKQNNTSSLPLIS